MLEPSAVSGGPAGRPFVEPANAVDRHTVAAVLALALLSTAMDYTIYFRLLATVGATNLLLVTLVIPATAIVLGVLGLGEVLLPRHAIGMLLIGCGVAAIDGRPWRRFRRWSGTLSAALTAPVDPARLTTTRR